MDIINCFEMNKDVFKKGWQWTKTPVQVQPKAVWHLASLPLVKFL